MLGSSLRRLQQRSKTPLLLSVVLDAHSRCHHAILCATNEDILAGTQKHALMPGWPLWDSQGQVIKGAPVAVVAQALLVVQRRAHEPAQPQASISSVKSDLWSACYACISCCSNTCILLTVFVAQLAASSVQTVAGVQQHSSKTAA